nr:heavy metal translocating P-type ATPase [Jiangella endophytica]
MTATSGKARRLATSAGEWRGLVAPALLVTTTVLFVVGVIAWLMDAPAAADVCWLVGTLVALIPAVGWVVAELLRRRAGVDLIAVLSLVGTALVGEYAAGALVAVMLATGRTLEAAAQRRASHDLDALIEHAPRVARRRVGDQVTVVALRDVRPGDLLVVGPGEVVPVDGEVAGGAAVLDESVLTGESLQVERDAGEPVRSGVVNAGPAFELRATATSDESTYAGIVRLARQAGAEGAPVVRLADRYAAWFLPLSLLVAGVAWIVSSSAVQAVAVLVVATPCPLLLAAPVAIVAGLSRAARRGVVVRDGAALENLGHATTLVMDKTGTLTAGRPAVLDVACAPGWEPDEVLRLAASADQLSPHVLASAIVAEARVRRLALSYPVGVVEEPGRGVSATVDGHRVEVGGARGSPPDVSWASAALNRAALDAAAIAWVSVDTEPVGAVLLRDPVRRDAPRTLRRLRSAGLTRLIMLTGDRREPAAEVASVLGLDDLYAQQSPADKVAAVRAERQRAVTVMVGDGVNDAPALAASSVGVAMGARGSTASSEAADIVLMADRLDRLGDAMQIARRSRRIAVQSAVVGMALSIAAMGVAAIGWLPPAAGALLQEGIDVAVILNALRALRGGRGTDVALPGGTARLVQGFAAEHDDLRKTLTVLRRAADQLSRGVDDEALVALRGVVGYLTEQLLPHERAEEADLYPALAEVLGGSEATATMSRSHAEIERLARRIGHHLAVAEAAGGVRPEQFDDLLASLYGLHMVLLLHFAQEEENYFVLADETTR